MVQKIKQKIKASPQPIKQSIQIKKEKTGLLFFLSIVLCFLFYIINQDWIDTTIMGYQKEYNEKFQNKDVEYRKINRWGASYYYAKGIDSLVKTQDTSKNLLVLMPPSAYFKKLGFDFDVPEPSVFYYFTRLHTTQAIYKNAKQSTWFVAADNGGLACLKFQSEQQKDSVIAYFKKFEN